MASAIASRSETPVRTSAVETRFYADVPLVTKSPNGSDGSLHLSGMASTWVKDRDGERVAPDAFDGSLDRYLQKNPILLWQHDPDKPIGKVTGGKVSPTGLYVEAVVPKPADKASSWKHDAYDDIRNGIVKTFSIGGQFERTFKGADPIISTVNLLEISAVSIPSNPDSLFEAMVKRLGGESTLRVNEKALSQLEQLLGFKSITDPDLARLDENAREDRYHELADLFESVHGVPPPPLGAYEKVTAAKDAGADVAVWGSALVAVADALYRPQTGAKAGRVLSQVNAALLQNALNSHIAGMAAHQEAFGAYQDVAQNLSKVLGSTNADGSGSMNIPPSGLDVEVSDLKSDDTPAEDTPVTDTKETDDPS